MKILNVWKDDKWYVKYKTYLIREGEHILGKNQNTFYPEYGLDQGFFIKEHGYLSRPRVKDGQELIELDFTTEVALAQLDVKRAIRKNYSYIPLY